ncbi:hypothetical protein SDC9_156860 [bioreactor metagenome]|uniref:Uncharacterized protein n=1 Tax=bioreactor metagenome TaxID=1076179 RepID=A0A645F8A8_9ZZZZ
MHYLVGRALQEGRIDAYDRAHPGRRESGCVDEHVFFGDAGVKKSLRVRLGKVFKFGAVFHRRGADGQPRVFAGHVAEHPRHLPAPARSRAGGRLCGGVYLCFGAYSMEE